LLNLKSDDQVLYFNEAFLCGQCRLFDNDIVHNTTLALQFSVNLTFLSHGDKVKVVARNNEPLSVALRALVEEAKQDESRLKSMIIKPDVDEIDTNSSSWGTSSDEQCVDVDEVEGTIEDNGSQNGALIYVFLP
jgi:NAD(P)-dependent dehydrogenase (short-subunit alcohol dehydrogenase family)